MIELKSMTRCALSQREIDWSKHPELSELPATGNANDDLVILRSLVAKQNPNLVCWLEYVAYPPDGLYPLSALLTFTLSARMEALWMIMFLGVAAPGAAEPGEFAFDGGGLVKLNYSLNP